MNEALDFASCKLLKNVFGYVCVCAYTYIHTCKYTYIQNMCVYMHVYVHFGKKIHN